MNSLNPYQTSATQPFQTYILTGQQAAAVNQAAAYRANNYLQAATTNTQPIYQPYFTLNKQTQAITPNKVYYSTVQ